MNAPVSDLTESKEQKTGMRYRLILPAVISLALLAGPFCRSEAQSADHEIEQETHDADRARRALEKGEILPLERVMARLRDTVPGEISGVELEQEGGRWIYEFKIISPSGRMREVRVDAKTGSVIGKDGE